MKDRENNKIISIADVILCVVIIIICAGALLFMRANKRSGITVSISVNGDIVKSMELDKDAEYRAVTDKGENLIVISDGCVRVEAADCPDRICVNHSEISNVGETIICLPHKLVVEIVD